jgi:Zn finger protein HypA/HybF involved in hydrogenase expression
MPITIRRRCYCDRCREPFYGVVNMTTGGHHCPRCGHSATFNIRPGSGGQYYRISWRKLGWQWTGNTYSPAE